ncbi:MAG TPA: N-acetyltransferase [Kofleriaceae bacterium]|nr:N-acetyltransferase [Kofleriaceae bacterium]
MAPSIRALRASDRPRLIAALESDSTFSEVEVDVALELIDNALEHGERDYIVRVADLPDFWVAGYICFGRTPMTDTTWDLYWVVTHAGARGRGVARALIEAMEVELRALPGTAVRVETSQQESHEAARRLYDRLGYPEVARFPDFYRAGDDLIVYYKKL